MDVIQNFKITNKEKWSSPNSNYSYMIYHPNGMNEMITAGRYHGLWFSTQAEGIEITIYYE